MLKGGHEQYTDEAGNKVSVEDFRRALSEWKPFIDWIRDWRAGRFTMTLSEWNSLPPIGKELIKIHDRIKSEIGPKKKT